VIHLLLWLAASSTVLATCLFIGIPAFDPHPVEPWEKTAAILGIAAILLLFAAAAAAYMAGGFGVCNG
jgi:hypothetical protein